VKAMWLIAALLLLMMGGTRTARRRYAEGSAAGSPPPIASRLRSLFRAIEWTTGILVGAILLCASVYQAWGPFWPTPPDIRAIDPVDGSSLILPFQISSTNVIFPVNQVTLGCYVDLLYVMDADRKTILLRDAAMQGGTTTIGKGVEYNCDARILSIQPDGRLAIGSLQGTNLTTAHGVFRGPLSVLKMCVAVVGTYGNWLFDGRKLPSLMFQWPSVPGGHQWANHPVVFDEEIRWVPQNSTLGAAYGLRRVGDGRGHLVPGALTCDRTDEGRE